MPRAVTRQTQPVPEKGIPESHRYIHFLLSRDQTRSQRTILLLQPPAIPATVLNNSYRTSVQLPALGEPKQSCITEQRYQRAITVSDALACTVSPSYPTHVVSKTDVAKSCQWRGPERECWVIARWALTWSNPRWCTKCQQTAFTFDTVIMVCDNTASTQWWHITIQNITKYYIRHTNDTVTWLTQLAQHVLFINRRCTCTVHTVCWTIISRRTSTYSISCVIICHDNCHHHSVCSLEILYYKQESCVFRCMYSNFKLTLNKQNLRRKCGLQLLYKYPPSYHHIQT